MDEVALACRCEYGACVHVYVQFVLLARAPPDGYMPSCVCVCMCVHACVRARLLADCDNDDHCATGLVCGTDNCAQFHGDALSSTTDCCELAPTTTTTTTTTGEVTCSCAAGVGVR